MNHKDEKEIYRSMLCEQPDILNIEQLCKILEISSKTGYKLLQSGKINSIKVGRAYRVPKVYLIDYLMLKNA